MLRSLNLNLLPQYEAVHEAVKRGLWTAKIYVAISKSADLKCKSLAVGFFRGSSVIYATCLPGSSEEVEEKDRQTRIPGAGIHSPI